MQGTEIIYENGKISAKSQFDRYNEPAELTETESAFADILKEILNKEIKIVRRSDNYLSAIAFNDGNFLRYHIGKKTNWFSVGIVGEARNLFYDDIRFSHIKNKNIFHWRIDINSIDQLYDYSDIIIQAYNDYTPKKL